MKRIGIYASSVGENSFGCGKTYLDFISYFGEPVILMPSNTFDKSIDMLLLPGGLDINPSSFGDVPGFFTSNTDVHKQFVYEKCLPNYVQNKVPIFGVCLGFQQLAAYFGCKLTQHLKFHEESLQRWATAHAIGRLANDIIPEKLGKLSLVNIDVNSHHHQAVTLKNFNAKDLQALYVATNYEPNDEKNPIIESFIHRELPIAGVQWHPEELYDDVSKLIINTLLNGSRNNS